MSSTVFAKPNPSPVVTRRPPISNETGSPRTTNRRSLSDKLRNLFRKDSPSPNRTASNDGRLPPTSSRQTSSSPGPTNEAPHLRAPTVNWPFGKKKTKSSTTTSTPTTNKTKIKGNRKTKQINVPPMEISNPIYQQDNQTSIYGEHFVPRSPDLSHNGTGRLQSLSSYEANTAKGFRDYIVIDQTQQSRQVVVPEVDVFMPPTYTSDRSRSPSMNHQRWANTEYHYHHDNSTLPPPPPPLSDIDVMPAPPRKRKGDDNSPLTTTQILAKKPPILPQTSSLQPINVTTNPNQWKSVSSSSLNNSGKRSTVSSSSDVNNPKLNAPIIPFGSSANKKKGKRSKSQSRPNGMTSSTSTINNLVQQNPVLPNRSWANTYGSLPDAEILYDSNLNSLKPSKANTNKYPWISAIVQHHMHPATVYYNERPYVTTTTTTTTPTTNLRRPERFETSTTTVDEYEPRQPWPNSSNNGSAPSPSSVHRHDGYIRPFTPQKPTVQPNVNVIRLSLEDLRGRTPSPPSRPSRYDSPEPPVTYRSSTTIYTRDKPRYVDGGEIRTWSSQDNGIGDDHINTYIKPHIHVHVERSRGQQLDRNDYQIVPPKIPDTYDEYRYSPRAHERDLHKHKQRIRNNDDDQEIHEEEQYEVSFEYEGKVLRNSYETRRFYDELHSTNRFSGNIDDEKNLLYSNVTSTARSSNITERDRSSRLYTSSEHIQEPLNIVAPVGNFKQIPRNYVLKRRDSYDGLGITISADLQTRSNHIIRDVERGSPGDQAGLRKNDRIISINGINVENVDFSNILALIKQGLDDDNLLFSVIHAPEHI